MSLPQTAPTVLVVQATEDAHGNDPPDPVNRSMDWGVFIQREVSPEPVVIGDVGCHDTAEVSLAEHDEMVETLRRIEPISRST